MGDSKLNDRMGSMLSGLLESARLSEERAAADPLVEHLCSDEGSVTFKLENEVSAIIKGNKGGGWFLLPQASFESSFPISHCPFCGVKLEEQNNSVTQVISSEIDSID